MFYVHRIPPLVGYLLSWRAIYFDPSRAKGSPEPIFSDPIDDAPHQMGSAFSRPIGFPPGGYLLRTMRGQGQGPAVAAVSPPCMDRLQVRCGGPQSIGLNPRGQAAFRRPASGPGGSPWSRAIRVSSGSGAPPPHKLQWPLISHCPSRCSVTDTPSFASEGEGSSVSRPHR